MSQNTSKNKKKILLTGGHAATSALAVIEKLQEVHPEWIISWIGSRQAFAKEKATTLDFQLFPKMGVDCYSIIAGKLQRSLSLSTFINLLKVPVGMIQSVILMIKIKPDLVLSFGGFAALPVTWSAWVLGIPVLIHEQTVAIGLANKLSLPFVKEVLLSRKQSKKYFGNSKTRLVGLPLHKALIAAKSSLRSRPQNIYITGGSRGSQNLNSALKVILRDMLNEFTVIHHTGQLDIDQFEKLKKELPGELRDKYHVKHTYSPSEMAKNYEKADIVIARAGAHTVAEVIALNKPAIFIPIPWVQMNEQYLNAKLAKKYAGSIIIDEKELSGEKLLESINTIRANWKRRTDNGDNTVSTRDRNATSEIVKVVENYVL